MTHHIQIIILFDLFVSCVKSNSKDDIHEDPKEEMTMVQDSLKPGLSATDLEYFRVSTERNRFDSIVRSINPSYYFGQSFEQTFDKDSINVSRNWPKIMAANLFLFEEKSFKNSISNAVRVSKYNNNDGDFVAWKLTDSDTSFQYHSKIPNVSIFNKPFQANFEILEIEFDSILNTYFQELSRLPMYVERTECCDGWFYLFEVKRDDIYKVSFTHEERESADYENVLNILNLLDFCNRQVY